MAVVIEREILKEDIPQIKDMLESAVGSNEYASIERLGGLTNHTYHVTYEDGKEYVVRLPGEGTEEVINRLDEKKSTELASGLGIDSELIYFEADGRKVSEYIPNAVTMDEESMQTKDAIEKAAEILRKLHSCNIDTGVKFDVFEMADTYEKFIYDNKVSLFDDYEERKKEVQAIKSELNKTSDIKQVPCHNDPLCANWIMSGDKMYLVDWEYAGMNDGMWDLAATSIEACFSPEHDELFLEKYLERDLKEEDRKHLIASKIFVDYLWTLWAKMRVPFDGQPMEDWAAERYERMIGFINAYKEIG